VLGLYTSTHQPTLPRTRLSTPILTMFAKVFTLALAGFAALAVAAPTDGGSGSSTGTPQCCQSVTNSSDPIVAALVKALIGVDVSGLNIPIGQGCSGISVVGGVSCNQNPVTCGSVYQGMPAIVSRFAKHTDSFIRRAHRPQLRAYHRQRMRDSSPARGSARNLTVIMSVLHASSV
jgi:hypothetical protein